LKVSWAGVGLAGEGTTGRAWPDEDGDDGEADGDGGAGDDGDVGSLLAKASPNGSHAAAGAAVGDAAGEPRGAREIDGERRRCGEVNPVCGAA
jgi:hypothetical protein